MQFHPSIHNWFQNQFDAPTAVQEASWPIIADGHHALITAPTGSGKTLTAFLWSLNQFATGAHTTGATRVIYISPLKALNNDIQRNLTEPLKQLEDEYAYPHLNIRTRSGDTSAGDRQRMLRQPPDILITTPESLGLLLTTAKGRQALSQVETVILDEVHSLIENRRGVQLMANLERLADLAGEFQRIALSATVRPLKTVAEYVAGNSADQTPRKIHIVDPAGDKQIQFRVRFPEAAKQAADEGKKIWDPIADDFRDIIEANHSTLFFTNSRRLAEKITLKINQDEVAPLAYAHHGSLAREVRNEVESRLKGGELKAIVATNSLEMGIDIGDLDEVVLVQSPPSVASTLQRIGRAGHGVGETSVGTLYPTHAQDFLEAAALAEAVQKRDIEPLNPMRGALDVLAQLIVSICATDPWPVQDIFSLIRRASPYTQLHREHFDGVIEMLAGRYSGSRIRELKPKLSYDRIAGTVKANRGAVLAMYNSGGTIPDRGYYKMRHVDSGGIIGELDEEFVWEATVGDNFTLGTQHWQIHRITHNDVIVRHAKPGASAPPFWRSEFFNRSFHYSQKIAQFLELQEHRLADQNAPDLEQYLQASCSFSQPAATELAEFLKRQRAHTKCPLPHRRNLLVELVRGGPAGYHGPDNPQQVVLHTYWGGCLNQPFALALRAAWHNRFGDKLDIHADNNAIVLQVKGDPNPHEILSLVTAANLLMLLRQSLESSGFFGARFRECAGRSLLLTKQRFNQRLPLWMSRMQAKKLMTGVKKLDDFPVLLETWRTCLDDEFDLPNLLKVLGELEDGTISWQFVTSTTPSPFAQHLTFNQVSRYMYADDTPEDDATSSLGEDIISQALHNYALRPRIEPAVIQAFLAKRQRHQAGYEPSSEEEWAEWVKERTLIPIQELPEEFTPPVGTLLVHLKSKTWLTHLETAHALYHSGLINAPASEEFPDLDDKRSATQLAREILSFYGPLTEAELDDLLPSVPGDLLSVDESFIHGLLIDGSPDEQWCDAENFETLMRMQRAQRRSSFAPKTLSTLCCYWAKLHRLGTEPNDDSILFALETLRGHPNHVTSWLTDLLPARLNNISHQTGLLDQVMQHHAIRWVGTGRESMTMIYPEEQDLLGSDTADANWFSAFQDRQANYSYAQIADNSQLTPSELNKHWWQAVWDGRLHSDTLTPLRQGMERKFLIGALSNARPSRRRSLLRTRTWSGTWRVLPKSEPMSPLIRLEADKDRVRMLLDRYGLINRDIVNRERLPMPAVSADGTRGNWRWRDAFKALRIMELAGEVFSGQFIADTSTPQFITPRAFSELQTNQLSQGNFWLSALDPAAPCGLGVAELHDTALPNRRAGNYLVFHNHQLALSITGNGRHLKYAVSADHADLDTINSVLRHILDSGRKDTSSKRLTIETINDEPGKSSPYLGALDRVFRLAQDHKSVFLEPNI